MASTPLDIFERLIGPDVLKQSCSSSSEASPSSSLNCRLRLRVNGARGSVKHSGLRLAELEDERFDSAEGAGDGGVMQKDVLKGPDELLELVGNDKVLFEPSTTTEAEVCSLL